MLGATLRRLREASGLSVSALSRTSGVSRSRIYDVESGKVKTPQGETLKGLARGIATKGGVVSQPRYDAVLLELVQSMVQDASKAEQGRQTPSHTFYNFIRRWPRLERDLAFLQMAPLDDEDVEGLCYLIETVLRNKGYEPTAEEF